ncbi:phosphatase PAP2 family protein [Streptomyces mobaraensis NBRC 13819 = DSM 40847]|uniref:Phosphatase PAP2 family protein n=2 Tax=Streptomyces mobaraensis TaxID=35621 RepID=A0A5N5VZT5_STRMB|nr:phosphatase PAP2 family protein [Streptomyces mobaraensis]QTT77632.1 phosphatase PAP2 family protein [Streptomyces mobaraensis NBRC 13819 = DSM 40847]
MTRTRLGIFVATSVVYAAIVVGVLTTSWPVRFDWQVMLFRPYKQWPEIHTFLDYFVVLGQRGPTAVAVAAWLGWCCHRRGTLRPLLVLGTSLLLLNATVGAAKIGMGRLGPHYATAIGSNEMFAGGDIFPSGHTANAVVTWGVLAYLATTPRARRIASVCAALLALGVGMTTVYLGTHWMSDVTLGWTAGLLVLLALPWFEPLMERAETWLLATWARLREHGAALAPAAAATPVGLWAPRPPVDDTLPVREPAGAGRAGRAAEPRPRAAARPHTTRSERTPVTPAGSRRPPHADRTPRTPPLPATGRGRTVG